MGACTGLLERASALFCNEKFCRERVSGFFPQWPFKATVLYYFLFIEGLKWREWGGGDSFDGRRLEILLFDDCRLPVRPIETL